jgi:RNA polymerase sigma-B factor
MSLDASTPATAAARPVGQPDRPAATPESPTDVTGLVLEHLWLADSIARRFRGRGEDDDDLQQVARCALLEAARRYDPAQGPFAPYASPTISGVLKRHFRDHGWVVRPPRQTQQLAVRITQQWSEVAQERGSLPSDRELADSLDETVTTIREARRASQGYRTVPIDGLTTTASSAAGDDPGFEQCEARVLVRQTWDLLSPEEQDLLWMRFWEQRSQSDIAAHIGTSQMQVSRLLSRTLTKLRKQLRTPEENAA